jgi:hypothetical protein
MSGSTATTLTPSTISGPTSVLTNVGTVTPFTPTSATTFQFGATLDGTDYVCTVTWNIAGQDWYLNVYTTSGVLVLTRFLAASPPGVPLNLLFGYFFTSTMVFWDLTQTFQVVP